MYGYFVFDCFYCVLDCDVRVGFLRRRYGEIEDFVFRYRLSR